MGRIGVKLCQEIPQHYWLQMDGADEDELIAGLLEADGAIELLLDLERLIQLLQTRDQVQDGRHDEEDDHCLAWPGYGEDIAIAHRAHGDHDEPPSVEEVSVDVVTEDMVDHAHPVY